jgi:hypothetical protein
MIITSGTSFGAGVKTYGFASDRQLNGGFNFTSSVQSWQTQKYSSSSSDPTLNHDATNGSIWFTSLQDSALTRSLLISGGTIRRGSSMKRFIIETPGYINLYGLKIKAGIKKRSGDDFYSLISIYCAATNMNSAISQPTLVNSTGTELIFDSLNPYQIDKGSYTQQNYWNDIFYTWQIEIQSYTTNDITSVYPSYGFVNPEVEYVTLSY